MSEWVSYTPPTPRVNDKEWINVVIIEWTNQPTSQPTALTGRQSNATQLLTEDEQSEEGDDTDLEAELRAARVLAHLVVQALFRDFSRQRVTH